MTVADQLRLLGTLKRTFLQSRHGVGSYRVARVLLHAHAMDPLVGRGLHVIVAPLMAALACRGAIEE